MKKRNLLVVGVLVCLLVGVYCLFGTGLKKDTAYYVIHSNGDLKQGGIVGLDEQGKRSGKKALAISDVMVMDRVGDFSVAGSIHANTHVVVDGKDVKTFSFLNDPRLVGVNAVGIHEGHVVGLMRGVRSDDGLQRDCLVEQDVEGQVYVNQLLPIEAKDVVCDARYAYVVGGNLSINSSDWFSKVIRYDFDSKESVEVLVDQDQTYVDAVLCNGDLYCVVMDALGMQNQIDVLDAETLERKYTMRDEDDIHAILTHGEAVYVVRGNSLASVTGEGIKPILEVHESGVVCNVVQTEDGVLLQTTYVNMDESGSIGEIVEVELNALEVKKTLPIMVGRKHMSNPLVIPVVK